MGLISAISLLSRLKLSSKSMDLEQVARKQHLFPLAGAAIAEVVVLSSVLMVYCLSGFLPTLVIGFLIVLIYFAVTGIIHIEGLADFADGCMASGDRDRKRAAMKDVSLGASGTIYLVGDFLLFYVLVLYMTGWIDSPQLTLSPWGAPAMIGLIIAELSAKLSMLTAMFLGPSSHPGMGSAFVAASNAKVFLAGKLIALSIAFLVVGVLFFLVLIGPIIGIAITYVARKNFGGVSGDAFGAANEIARLATLLAWVLLI